MRHQKKHNQKSCFSLALLAMVSLLLSSCGLRDNPEPFSDGAKDSAASAPEAQEDIGEPSGEEDHSPIPVAEFQYIKLSMQLSQFDTYAFNQEWLYYVNTKSEEENGRYTLYTSVCQDRISGGSKSEEFISDEELNGLNLLALLADREGSCYTFGKRWGNEAEGIPPCFVMEKRSPEGVLKWRREYAPEELDGRGDQLNQGTIAQDGRIYLYAQGAGGSVLVFDEEGAPESICTPGLSSLDGIVAGAAGSVYGYCAAGDATSFVRLDNPEELYVCPMVPAQIFDGREDGVYLSDKESLWSYTPESAETRKLWDWDDEYVQISADAPYADTRWETRPIAGICRGEDSVTVLCTEQSNNSLQNPFLTFASIAFRDRSEYPARKAVTLGLLSFTSKDSSYQSYLIRRYNRQSREYKVELISFATSSALVTSIVRGDGPDLVETSLLNAGLMTAAGTALEDLTDYYAASEKISPGDILPAVRDAGLMRDKNVLVIPAFYISCMSGMKELPAMEDWTVWNFLAMGREKRMFQKQSPMDALLCCMGVQRGVHFIDYEKMECHFDSPDFRRILEECLAWETYDGNDPNDYMPIVIDGQVVDHRTLPLEEAPWLFSEGRLDNRWSTQLFYDKDCPRTYVGYPGWDGAEYELMASDVFAMTSSSQNKTGAWDFLEFLLSPELQDDIDWGFPARADSLDAQLAEAQNQDWRKDLRPSDEAVAYLRRILDSAVYISDQNSIWFIISEEAQMYFAGDATLDDTVSKIQRRVQNYLDELGE